MAKYEVVVSMLNITRHVAWRKRMRTLVLVWHTGEEMTGTRAQMTAAKHLGLALSYTPLRSRGHTL